MTAHFSGFTSGNMDFTQAPSVAAPSLQMASQSTSALPSYGLALTIGLVAIVTFGIVKLLVVVVPDSDLWRRISGYIRVLKDDEKQEVATLRKKKSTLNNHLKRLRDKSRMNGTKGSGGSSDVLTSAVPSIPDALNPTSLVVQLGTPPVSRSSNMEEIREEDDLCMASVADDSCNVHNLRTHSRYLEKEMVEVASGVDNKAFLSDNLFGRADTVDVDADLGMGASGFSEVLSDQPCVTPAEFCIEVDVHDAFHSNAHTNPSFDYHPRYQDLKEHLYDAEEDDGSHHHHRHPNTYDDPNVYQMTDHETNNNYIHGSSNMASVVGNNNLAFTQSSQNLNQLQIVSNGILI